MQKLTKPQALLLVNIICLGQKNRMQHEERNASALEKMGYITNKQIDGHHSWFILKPTKAGRERILGK